MNASDTHTVMEICTVAIEAMRLDIKKDLQEFVESAIEAHRRRIWVRDRWCCEAMINFASKAWLMTNPPKRDESAFGGVTLQLRGETVNYCPFCGVRVDKS